jgi:hypothetical protein
MGNALPESRETLCMGVMESGYEGAGLHASHLGAF